MLELKKATSITAMKSQTDEIIESVHSDNQTDVNYCARRVKRKVMGKEIEMLCGGMIVIQSIHYDDKKKEATVLSRCGLCGEEETDNYQCPELTHSSECELAQKRGEVPTVYLQTVIPEVIWKCGGVIPNDITERGVPCNALVVQKEGGYPF